MSFGEIEWAEQRVSADQGAICLVHLALTLGDVAHQDLVVEVKRTAGAGVADALEVIVPTDFPAPMHYRRLRECVERHVRAVGQAAGIKHLTTDALDDGGREVAVGRTAPPGRCIFETDVE